MKDDFQILVSKLDKFIKKYYFNKIIRGLILSLAICGLWYLAVVILEYYGRFSSSVRMTLLITTLAVFTIVFVFMILIPILKLFKIGKCISYNDAGKILGKHFPEISDKLQNTLELKQLLEETPESADLIYASIAQRLKKLVPIPFLAAINIKGNVKYLKYLVPVLIIFVAIFAFKPAIVTDGTTRIVKYNEEFVEPAPFAFFIENDSMVVKRGDDFTVKVKVDGEYLPDQVMINYGGNNFFMKKESKDSYSYDFKKLNNSMNFFLSAVDVTSQNYEISVLPAPIILNFKINIYPPAYTGLNEETINNSGDIEAPIGSSIVWSFGTANLDSLAIVVDSTTIPTQKIKSEYSAKKTVMNSCEYMLYVANKYFSEIVDIKYKIRIIPDLYPSISVSSIADSSQLSIIYFKGMIDDDYGFSKLTFRCYNHDREIAQFDVPFTQRLNSQDFYYAFDFADLNITDGDISYCFEVADNDGIHGPKTSRSDMMNFSIPSQQDLQDMSDKTNESSSEKAEEAKKLSKDIKKNIDELKKKLINENLSPFERSQLIQEILDEETRLDDLMNNIKQEQEQVQQYKEQFSKNEELLKKQEEINSLLENLMTDEMRKMMEELRKMMENFNKDEFFKKSEEYKLTMEDVEKNLENTLELLRRSEIEDRVKNIADQLKNLSDKQEKLSEETKKKDLSQDELKNAQEDQKNQFEKLKEEYEKTLEKNSDLKEPMSLQSFEKQMDEISQEMQKAEDNLNDNKNSKASDNQKNSSDKMEQLSEQMSSMMQEAESQEMEENLEDVRQVLENVITFSYDEEDIMLGQKNLAFKSPLFKEYIVKQKNLGDNFSIIKDSLDAMSARIPGLAAMIKNDVSQIRTGLSSIMDDLSNNRKYQAQTNQQKVLTSANNLALLLTELMDQMQEQQMQSQSSKSKSSCNKCKKQGNGQPKQQQMGQMRNMQEMLKKQMQEMMNQMKNGQPKSPQQSEQLAKMLMQQEMMQKMMNDMMNGVDQDAAKYLKEANKMMEENMKDVINGNITKQTLWRQDQIITRMLQAEKSDNEREIEKQRRSNEAKDYKLSNPDEAFKEKESEIRFNELLQMSNVQLQEYYKTKYKNYLKNLNEQ